jgi:putative intracellular protease/amidase
MNKILTVLTSHDQLGNTGAKTGFWLEEFAAPYYVFKDAGATITLASPLGGQSCRRHQGSVAGLDDSHASSGLRPAGWPDPANRAFQFGHPLAHGECGEFPIPAQAVTTHHCTVNQ